MSKVYEILKEQVNDAINKMIKGDKNYFSEGIEIEHCSFGTVGKILSERFGRYDNDDFDTNGWQSDQWETMKVYDVETDSIYKFALFGSGYYGGVEIKLARTEGNCDGYCDECSQYQDCSQYQCDEAEGY